MRGPILSIDLDIIERNARTVVTRCAQDGIAVVGVTKGTCGQPDVAAAMLRGGVQGLAESRLENLARLRGAGITASMLLLRQPAPSQADQVVRLADASLNSELATLHALSAAALRAGRLHQVILMVDLGDLREGLWPDQLLPAAVAAQQLPGIVLSGIGTNLNCLGGVLPSTANMRQLLELAAQVRQVTGLPLPLVSAGNSGALPLLLAGAMPAGVSQLRIGEAILQGGRDTFFERPWPALERNAFTLSGALLEVKTKPTVPIGERGVDAFGRRPDFPDQGLRLRGVLDIGQQDASIDSLFPLDAGVRIVGGSSDHLVVDLAGMPAPPKVGQRLRFALGYGSLLRAMTSSYVEKHFL